MDQNNIQAKWDALASGESCKVGCTYNIQTYTHNLYMYIARLQHFVVSQSLVWINTSLWVKVNYDK